MGLSNHLMTNILALLHSILNQVKHSVCVDFSDVGHCAKRCDTKLQTKPHQLKNV